MKLQGITTFITTFFSCVILFSLLLDQDSGIFIYTVAEDCTWDDYWPFPIVINASLPLWSPAIILLNVGNMMNKYTRQIPYTHFLFF